MLGAEVSGITLVYAEKVKFISFTFPAHNRAGFPAITVPEAVLNGGV
jgi:hypothetical protein